MKEKIISSALIVLAIFFLPIFITTILTDIEQDHNMVKDKLIHIQYDEGEVQLPLEEYLIGVVAAQMPAYFEDEALKAQAVIARTNTIKKYNENPNIIFTEDIQGYYSNKKLENMWGVNDYAFYYSKIRDAVWSTKNKVITYNKELIDAIFHSTSIGITRSAKDTWGQDIPYLQASESLEDINSPKYLNKYTFTYNDFQEKCKLYTSDILFTKELSNEIQIIERNKQGYVLSIQVGNKIYSGEEFRKAFELSSSNFEISFNKDGLEIICKGCGHGVGFSQYGAEALASSGNSYEKILLHFYKEVVIEENK